jgi:hypothetical protein
MTEPIHDVVDVASAPETAASTPPPGGAEDRSIDDLLAEFDRATATPERSADPPAVPIGDGANQTGPIDDLLREFDPAAATARQRIEELSGQVNSFRAVEFQRQEREAAEQWAAELQAHVSRMNPNLDDSFVRDRLLVMVAENPALEQAWRFRNLTDADIAKAQKDFRGLEAIYAQTQKAPEDPRKAEALALMERRGQELQLMLSARQLIRTTRNTILKRADSVKPPYDPDASFDREMVAQAVRDGRGELNPQPEKIEWGKLSGTEGRRKVQEEFGFDPGWGH